MGSGDGGGDEPFCESSSFFCGVESGVPGEQRSIVSDLSSVSLELATIPLSLLLPQSSVKGFNAGGDLLSMTREVMVVAIGSEIGIIEAGASAGGCENARFDGCCAGCGGVGGVGDGLVSSLPSGEVDVALVATDADRTSFGTGGEGGTNLGGFEESTGVIEIDGLFSWTGTSLGGSELEIGLIVAGAGGFTAVFAVLAMMIFWLPNVFMMGLAVVE